MTYLLIDTSVIIGRLRSAIDDKTWNSLLSGRTPVISPVTLHELRRGIRPKSLWEENIDNYLAPVTNPPSTEDWSTAADLIRSLFWNTYKGPNLSLLQNDALIAITAKKLNAELWSRDRDMKMFCKALGVRLLID
jgi:predicted nucleic acid-binding protein